MSTIDYYNENAEGFFTDTIDVDMKSLYQPFLELLPPKAHILDAGCGSGRDALAFKNLGYTVTAFDGSAKLAVLATNLLGQRVEHLTFEELSYKNQFDGIWACASLLHVTKDEMESVFEKIIAALKTPGVIYASFKYGDEEFIKAGRFFNSYTEKSIIEIMVKGANLKVNRVWTTQDQRESRNSEKWINVILLKI